MSTPDPARLRTKLDLKLGYSCQNHCVHCVITDQRQAARACRGNEDRSLREVARELVEGRRRGAGDVVVTGGEPTLRRDLLVILQMARDLGYRVHLQTNGRRFADPALVQRLVPYQARFLVALHGPDAATHDAITQAPGSFDQTVQGLGYLLAAGQRVLVKTVLSRGNAGRVTEIAALLVDLGVPLLNVAFPHAIGEAGRRFDEIVPRYADVVPDLVRAIDTFGARLDIGLEALPFCLIPGLEAHVSDAPQRDARWQVEHRQLDGGPLDWRAARAEQKAKPATCRACRFDDRCEGVWREYLERVGGAELVPVLVVPA